MTELVHRSGLALDVAVWPRIFPANQNIISLGKKSGKIERFHREKFREIIERAFHIYSCSYLLTNNVGILYFPRGENPSISPDFFPARSQNSHFPFFPFQRKTQGMPLGKSSKFLKFKIPGFQNVIANPCKIPGAAPRKIPLKKSPALRAEEYP